MIGDQLPRSVDAADDWPALIEASHAKALNRLEDVRLALLTLEEGGHSTNSRDFGRGVAYACKKLRAALT